MGKNKKMGKIEEDFSEDGTDETAPPKRITLAQFDWFEFENRARKLMSEMLEPIYQRQHDSTSQLKESRKTQDLYRKKSDEHQFLLSKQAKRIENVERLWDKLTEMERTRRDEENRVLTEFSSFKTDIQSFKYSLERSHVLMRDCEHQIERQKEDVTLAQNMILDLRQGLMEDIQDHLKQTTGKYAEMHESMLSVQDRLVEAEAHVHHLMKEEEEMKNELMQTAEQTKRVKEIVQEVSSVVERKVEQENYEQGNRFINNDLKVLEQKLRTQSDAYKSEVERRFLEMSDYLVKFQPVEVQATVSATLAQVLSRKKDLVNLANLDKEKFKDFRSRIVPSSVEEQNELKRIEEEVEKRVKKSSRKMPEVLKTLQEQEEPSEGQKGAEKKKKPAQKYRKSLSDALKEKRRESVSVMLEKIKAKMDGGLIEEMKKEEEEWEKIRKGLVMLEERGTEEEESLRSSAADIAGRYERTSTGRQKYQEGIRKPKQFSEDTEGGTSGGEVAKRGSKKEEEGYEPARGARAENIGFFRPGRAGGGGGSVGFKGRKKVKRSGIVSQPVDRRLIGEDERIEEDPDSLRDSGSYVMSKNSFRLAGYAREGSVTEENISNFSREQSARTSQRNPLLKTVSRGMEDGRVEEDILSHRMGTQEIMMASLDSDAKMRAIATAHSSHRSSIHSAKKSSGYRESRFTPSNELDGKRAALLSAEGGKLEKQPIRVQETIPMAGGGRSDPQSSDYNSVEGGIDAEQLQAYLEDYVKEETVMQKVEELKEWVERNISQNAQEIEEGVEKQLNRYFAHLKEVTESRLNETNLKFKTAADDMHFYVQNLESQVEQWVKKERRNKHDKLGDLDHIQEAMNKVAKESSLMSQGLENIASIVACLVEHADMVIALMAQDDEDKKNIALVGYKEGVLSGGGNSQDFAKTSYAGQSSAGSVFNQSMQGGFFSPRSVVTAGAQTSRGVVVPDKKCLSCSGNKQVIMQAFKLACLAYAPSNVLYRGKVLNRAEMRTMAQCITEACNDVIHKQEPFLMKQITTKRYFDDMYVEMKMNEQRMLKKVHTLEITAPSTGKIDQSNQATLPTVSYKPPESGLGGGRITSPGKFTEKQSFESFDSLRLSAQERRKSREKKSHMTGQAKGQGQGRQKILKAVNVGDMHNESSNESLPLISPKRIGTPRV